MEPLEGTLVLELLNFRGTSLWQAPVEVVLPPNQSGILWRDSVEDLLRGADPGQVVLSAELRPSFGSAGPGTGIQGPPPPPALFYFRPPKELDLEAPAIRVTWEPEGESLSLTLVSEGLAKDVYLRFADEDEESPGVPASPTGEAGGDSASGSEAGDAPITFSENFFDLLPGRPKKVTVHTGLPLEVVQRGLRIRTLAEIPREGLPSGEAGQ